MQQLFAADDKFPSVVAALEARGWRRLPFVGCPKFDLKWTNYSKISWWRVTPQQIVSHLQNSITLSQKDQLLRLLYARGNEEQIQVDRCFPRTFDLSQPQERRLLKFWFHYSQAVAVLLETLRNGVKVDAEQVEAAIKLVKTAISNHTTAEERREIEGVLSELERRDPQFHVVGNVWICKPSNLSQGRGIVLCSSFEEIEKITSSSGEQDDQGTETTSSQIKWIVQKYIERPLLLQNDRKFDIRQWVLITELEPKPTVFWFYKSYLRFCSRRYELTRLQDRFTHLSNFSPMWSSDQFRDTLRQKHGRDVWEETILPQMHNTARLTLDAALPKLKAVGRGFEWLGFDFLVDEHHHSLLNWYPRLQPTC
ncbi:tubulin-tyrosine ligase family, putative [Phytophthora infestans T30-4]|uniref:Tubulin-tyrosine ligase family, putative n=1 Tax=Phytophthora infestans (strain T30-4) TaxID=403677 RepID=D0ND47_PHYIT|nr:tubulin-tyrosine ligase family, putative [Phytophthora infestans T30-4]EEY56004.1 tubulin-tyrosine ligase family, putative [Phytophthora infestans T30-4]|eukprot:XP_002902834.1 tubulin-tyrosine ligase family, putative [Phytophthora infestans T30-4]